MQRLFYLLVLIATMFVTALGLSYAPMVFGQGAPVFFPDTDGPHYVIDIDDGCAEWASNVLTSTGSGCGSGGGGSGADPFPSGATSTQLTFTGGIIVNSASSTITNLTLKTSTTTHATTTSLAITGRTSTVLTTDASGIVVASSTLNDSYITDALTISSSGSVADGALSANVSLLGQTIAVGELASADFGDFTCNGSACTVDANSVALTTDTTGNYIESITGTAKQITVTNGSGAEDLDATLSLPTYVLFPGDIAATNASTTNATTTGVLAVTGSYATTTNFFANGLRSCHTGNMLTWTNGAFGCEDDSTGAGGGGQNSKFATSSTDTNAIYPNAITNSVIIGSSHLFGENALLALFATSTSNNSSLLYASTTSSFTGNYLTFEDHQGLQQFSISSEGEIYAKGELYSETGLSTDGDVYSALGLDTDGPLDVNGITSALTLTDADGTFGEYTGTSCTNQFVRSLSVLGVATCASINNGDWSGTDLSVANGGTGLSTFGGSNTILYTTTADTLASEAAFTYTASSDRLTVVNASTTALNASTFFAVPSSSGQTNFAAGSLHYDTTSGTLVMGTSTTQGVVIASATSTLWAFGVSSSTNFYFASGQYKEIFPKTYPTVVTGILCKVVGGTSKVITLSDDGTNDANSVTCTSSWTYFPLTSNNTFNAYEGMRIEMGATTGTVDEVLIDLKGYRTTD